MSEEKLNLPKKTTTRLPSLKEPRDLTLGGIVKRKFVPIIPAPKSKKGNVKVEEEFVKNEFKYEGKNKGKEKSNTKDFKGKHKNDLIQLKSIFDDGPKEELRIKHEALKRSYSDRESSSSYVKIEKNYESGENKKLLKQLLNDDFIVEDDNSSSELDEALKDYKEIKIKDSKPTILPFKKESPKKPDVKEFSFQDFFKDDLFLVELPDILPGYPPTDHDILSNKKAEIKEEKRHLSAFNEGHIGKLRYHRNGKMTLCINEIIFNVDLGLTSNILQEVILLDMKDEENANLTVLGNVTKKLNLIPDIDSMLDSIDIS